MREVTVHLVRHGQSTWNVERRLQGQIAHPPLTEQGRVDAMRAAHTLRERLGGQGARLLTSDLQRARQTAAIIAEHLGLVARATAALREQHLGDMQGRLTSELRPEPTPEGAHVSEVRWGGGESLQDVAARLTAFFDATLPALERDHLILVTHGDTLRVARAVLAGRTHRDVDWDVVPNGAVSTIKVTAPSP